MTAWLTKPPKNVRPFQYAGSKHRLGAVITEYIMATPHQTYVEVFGGTAAVMMRKPRSPVEVYNDKDSRMACLFRFLSDPELFKRLWQRFALSLHCREYRHKARLALHRRQSSLTTAWAAAVCLTQGYGGAPFRGWSYSSSQKPLRKVISAIYNLPVMHERLKGVIVRELDFLDVLSEYDSESTVFYCDPPYVLSTLGSQAYDLHMTDAEHERLVEALLTIRGSAIVSGYEHPIYAPLVEHGWRRVVIPASSSMARKPKRGSRREEVLWLSPGIAEQECGPLFK